MAKATKHKPSQRVVGDRTLISRFAQEIVRSRSDFFTFVLLLAALVRRMEVDVLASPIE